MADKRKLELDIYTGDQAATLLKQLSPIIEDMKQSTFETFCKSSFLDFKGRHRAYLMSRAIDLFHRIVKKRIDAAKIASDQLNQTNVKPMR